MHSLSDRPELYPGDWSTGGSGYLHRKGYMYPLSLAPGQTLAQATVTLDGGSAQTGRSAASLSMHLEQTGAIEVDKRHPVVAVGSNAYARQITDKFAGTQCDDTIPLFPCVTRAISVCFCPFYASKGYVPATASKSKGHLAHVWLQLLTDEQFDIVTATEGNYSLVWIAGEEAGLTTNSGHAIGGCHTYWHREALMLFGDRVYCAWAHPEMKQEAMTESEVLHAISGRDIESMKTPNVMLASGRHERGEV